jgi:hypothetical protein
MNIRAIKDDCRVILRMCLALESATSLITKRELMLEVRKRADLLAFSAKGYKKNG